MGRLCRFPVGFINTFEDLRERLVSDARRMRLAYTDNPILPIGQELPHKVTVLAGKILVDEDDVHGPPEVCKKW